MKKDLTFIHLGNDSKVEGLVNFEKLRMIAKEIRHTCNMASAQYVSSLSNERFLIDLFMSGLILQCIQLSPPEFVEFLRTM